MSLHLPCARIWEYKSIWNWPTNLFRCIRDICFNIKKYTRIKFRSYILTVKPKYLRIHGTVNGKIFGQEGKSLTLLCTVISGIPAETLTWYNMSSVIGTGGPGMLLITILPTRYDHKTLYTCRATSNAFQQLLQKTVTLEIQCEFFS